MSQRWEYRAVELPVTNENKVNDALAKWAAEGWELVNGSYGDMGLGNVTSIWLFWRRAK